MQDSEGNHLVPLPPVRVAIMLVRILILTCVQVEMTLIPVTLTDEARVRSNNYLLIGVLINCLGTVRRRG